MGRRCCWGGRWHRGGDLAARVLVLLAFEADLARRDVRLRVGAMIVVLCIVGCGDCGGGCTFFRLSDLELFGDLAGPRLRKLSAEIPDEKRSIFTIHSSTILAFCISKALRSPVMLF